MTAPKATAPKKAPKKEIVKNDAPDAAILKAAHEKAIRDKNNSEMKAAKAHLSKFQDTSEFSALPADVQKAIKRVCGKVRVTAARDSFADTLKTLFVTVGDAVTELDIYLKTKMGRGEFRKRIRESLKKATPEARMWVEFNETTESWELLAVGVDLPKGFRGAPIDVPKTTTPKA